MRCWPRGKIFRKKVSSHAKQTGSNKLQIAPLLQTSCWKTFEKTHL